MRLTLYHFRKRLLLNSVLFFLAIVCSYNLSYAEGSGTWNVTDNRQVNLFVSATSGGGSGNTGYQNRGFMMLSSSTPSYDPAHRLFVRVKPGETVYWGFRRSNSGDVTFNWYYDDNDTTFYPTATTSGNGRIQVQTETFNAGAAGGAQGRPASGAAAAAGPSQIVTGGYNAYSFTNTTGKERTFWVEIAENNIEFNYWDITVADASDNIKDGRVYCKYWNTVNELPNS